MDNPVLVQLVPTIFSFLTFEELNRCSETCKDWREFTSSSHAKELWCAFHKRIWASAKFNVPSFCVCGKEQTLLDRIARVDSFDLVNFLGQKRCEMDVKTTVAKLLFAKEIQARRFTHSHEIIPAWLYKLNHYKASYIQSKLELRRPIFASDLVAYNWSFIYRMNVEGAFQNSAAKFFADGTLVFDFSDFVHQYRVRKIMKIRTSYRGRRLSHMIFTIFTAVITAHLHRKRVPTSAGGSVPTSSVLSQL